MYIPIIYKLPQTKKEWKNFSIVFGLVFIAFSIFIIYCFADGYNSQYQLSDEKNPLSSQITDCDEIFEFNNAAVIGYYATTESDYSATYYHFMVAYFNDATGDTAHLATITLNKNDGELFDKMLAYSDSDDFEYLSFFAHTDSAEQMNKDLYPYYKDAVDDCLQSFDNIENSGLRLFYCFDKANQFDDYLESQKENIREGWIAFIIVFAAGAALIIFGAVKRGPTKKQLAQAREYLQKQEQYNTPQYANPEEDDRFSYIHSDEYFQKPSEDYNINNE